MKLYFSPAACSLAPHIVLREIGTPFTLEKVDTAKHLTQAGADYYAITSELHKTYTPLFSPEIDAAAKGTLRTVLRKKYEWVDAKLAGRDHLTGDAFTAADAYLFVVTGWAKFVDLDLSGLTNLQGFLKRVAARPAVREAMKAEGLLS